MIEFKDFSVSYKDNVILENINFEIQDNGINFLMGKNGSGKTTLIKCILNLMDYKGVININCTKNSLSELFVIFDDSALYNSLSGIKNIMQFTSCDEKTAIKIGEQYFNINTLKKATKTYSYGERKKVFLIILEILKPAIIIMDEVSNGLDYETMILLRKKLIEFSKHSLILMTGHQFEFYKNIVDKVFIIKNKSISKVDISDDMSLEDIYENIVR